MGFLGDLEPFEGRFSIWWLKRRLAACVHAAEKGS